MMDEVVAGFSPAHLLLFCQETFPQLALIIQLICFLRFSQPVQSPLGGWYIGDVEGRPPPS